MRNRNGSIREKFEKAFTGVAAVAMIAFIAAGTFQMCLPGVVA